MNIYKFSCIDNLPSNDILGKVLKLEITIEALTLEDARNRAIFFHPINWVLVNIIV